MSGFIYLWYDKKHKRFYIGSHWGLVDDGYICSSTNMRENYKNRSQDFKRRILSKITTNRIDLLVEEQRWLDMIKPNEFGKRYYNINAKAANYLWWMNEETKKTVSEKIRQKHLQAKRIGYWKGKKLSKETKEKISKSKLGKSAWWNKEKKHSLEHRRKNSMANKGKVAWNKGKQTGIKPWLGKKRSEKSKQKMSISHIGQISWAKGKTFTKQHRENLSKAQTLAWKEGRRI